MSRLLIAGLMLVGFAPLTPAQETDKAPEASRKTEAEASPAKQTVIDNPDDVAAIRKYFLAEIAEMQTLIQTNPDAAEKKLEETREFVKTLKPKEKTSQQLLTSLEAFLMTFEQRIELARLSLEDIKKQLEKDPEDAKAIQNYGSKLASMISPIARKEPDKAEQLMTQGQKFLKGLEEKAEEDDTKSAVKRALTTIGRYERTIEGAKKLAALIGTEAPKLEVEAWVNGEPLTDENLKDKVVLLDFWAVWCGPCIATFPHLREWDKKYDDLVIIGVTNYYKYAWDEKAERAKRGEKVSEEEEQDMLVQFAKHHELTHHFALQADRKMSEHYGVTGIPQAVVIDRQGKIRLIRVGSGEANAKEIEEMIEKLIEE